MSVLSRSLAIARGFPSSKLHDPLRGYLTACGHKVSCALIGYHLSLWVWWCYTMVHHRHSYHFLHLGHLLRLIFNCTSSGRLSRSNSPPHHHPYIARAAFGQATCLLCITHGGQHASPCATWPNPISSAVLSPSPQSADRNFLEGLVQSDCNKNLTDIGPTSYATEQRVEQSQIVQSQATHHYAAPHASIKRALKGTKGHPDVRYLRTTFRNITQPTMDDVENLYRKLADTCHYVTFPRAHAASSKDRHNRVPTKYIQTPRDPIVTDYYRSCKV
jgi:hypothetical protein